MKNLPNKPSELILLALHDLELVEASPNYEVNMFDWHNPTYPIDEPCYVCFAGAVMAFSLNASINKSLRPGNFDDDTSEKLIALDCFRQGRIAAALDEIGYTCESLEPVMEFADYQDDPEEFKLDMKNLARDLGRNGL